MIRNSVNAFVVSSLDRVCNIFKHPNDDGKTTTSSVIIVHAYATIGDAADRITFYLTDRGERDIFQAIIRSMTLDQYTATTLVIIDGNQNRNIKRRLVVVKFMLLRMIRHPLTDGSK